MLFNSIEFLLFFPVVVALYFALPSRYRWPLLLAASYLFYMCWKPAYIILIVASTLIDYGVGRRLAVESRQPFRRAYLLLSIVANLGLLFSFKYFNFFNDTLRSLSAGIGVAYPVPVLNVLLPVGISFYTFQTLSYTIDVYRRKIQPERHLGIFALFVSFFPQLVAGPIERAANLLPQFYNDVSFDYERVVSGLQRMAWGFFKKVVIADRLAFVVDTVYTDPTLFSSNHFIIATYAFALQIYYDFSAYSDIAIGAARVLGFHLMENFDRPYYAKSIPEFWRRWHMSLSTWFRDYVYIPLGGRRVSVPRWCLNIMVVFIVSGLWHGANWTFVIWGALHGLFMLAALLLAHTLKALRWSSPLPTAVTSAIKMFVTFHLVTFAWIFFRARTLADAAYIVRHLFTNIELTLSGYGSLMPGGKYEIAIAGVAILLMEYGQRLYGLHGRLRLFSYRQPLWLRWSAYYMVVLMIIMFGKFGLQEFIYFQF